MGGLFATLYPSYGLHGDNLGWILLFNVASFLVVDIIKIGFRKMIGEEPGDIIESDDLIEPPVRTDAEKTIKKGLRYNVHRESVLDVADRQRVVEVKERDAFEGFFDLGTDITINGGFVNKGAAMRTSIVGVHPVTGRTRRIKQASSPY